MKKQTQLQWLKQRLLNDGFCSRNGALQNYITRIGARVNDLKNEGWVIEGKWYKTEHGRDYRYYFISGPGKRVEYRLPTGEVVGRRWE